DQQDVHSFGVNSGQSSYHIIQESEDKWMQGELKEDNKQKGKGRHHWWIRAKTADIAVGATVKDFYQRYPKGLTGNSEGIQVDVLPLLSENKDSFIHANQIKD